MKTLRLLMAIGLLLGSYTVGMAQSKSVATEKAEKKEVKKERFSSEAEKEAWIKENPEKYNAEKAETKANSSVNTDGKALPQPNVQTTRVRTNKVVAPTKLIPANTVKATSTVSEAKSVEQVKVVRVNNTTKALPANYKPASTQTKKSDK